MTSQITAEDDALLDKLYATPLSTGVLQLPGPTYESAQSLLEILRENRKATLYNLQYQLYSDAYKTYDRLGSTVECPEAITEKNYLDHLGEAKYYAGYLTYFSEYLRHHGPSDALEHFVLSPTSNFIHNLDSQDKKRGSEGKKQHPEMLNRLLSGHAFPFVHIAYGWELGIPGQVAEGLAVTAVHPTEQSEIMPSSLFGKAKEFTSHFMGLPTRFLFPRRAPVFHERRATFMLLHHVIDCPDFANDKIGAPGEERRQYPAVLGEAGNTINVLTNKWARAMKPTSRRGFEGMVEEVIWSIVIYFGVGGWDLRDKGQPFRADFATMQLVTSAYFLLALVLLSPNVPYRPLSQANRLALFKAYTAMWVGRCVAHGWHNKELPIAEFLAATREQLSAPAAAASSPFVERKALDARIGPTVHPDAHVAGITRALAAFAARWGSRGPGYFGGEDGMKGLEALDGTLFVRVAGLVMDKLGWAYESGHELGQWDGM
ncbi:hypothetical protein BJY52DRAFT_1223247 [Lactarius psammicola]|nr:hypothetical protein BJY52DRAFT_1223247 [Lactarius psammicola]